MFHNESSVLVASIVGYGMFTESIRGSATRASSSRWRNRARSAVTIGVFANHGGLRA